MKSEWKVYTVQELIDAGMLEPPMDGNHGAIHPKASDYVSSGVPFIMANDLVNGKVDFKHCVFITEKQASGLKKGFAHPGDVLLTHKATIGRTAIVENEYDIIILTPQVTYYRVKKGISNYYLKCYFDSSEFQNTLSNWAGSGSTRAYLGITAQHKLPIVLPPLEIQLKIAKYCTIIDDKIALNNKINENLEQQARLTLNWWMGEHSREYKSLPLSDIATVNDSVYSPKEQWHFVNYLDTSSITDGIITELQHIVPAIDKLPSRARRKIVTNDIVFSTVRPNQHHFGIIKQPVSNMLVSTGFAVIRSKTKEICNELIYLRLTEDSFIESMQQIAEQSTSTFPSIKPSDLYQCEIPCPIDDKLTILLENVFSIIAINQKENLGLSQLRDALLSKLMNGEIEL